MFTAGSRWESAAGARVSCLQKQEQVGDVSGYEEEPLSALIQDCLPGCALNE